MWTVGLMHGPTGRCWYSLREHVPDTCSQAHPAESRMWFSSRERVYLWSSVVNHSMLWFSASILTGPSP